MKTAQINSPTNIPILKISRSQLEILYGPELYQYVKTYKRTSIDLVKETNHLTFLHLVRDRNLIPEGLKIELPVNGRRTPRISDRASLAFVRESRRVLYHRKLNEKIFKNTITLEDSVGMAWDKTK